MVFLGFAVGLLDEMWLLMLVFRVDIDWYVWVVGLLCFGLL